MQAFHVQGMGFKVGSLFVEVVVKIEVQVLGLEVGKDENAWHGPGNLPKW